MDKKIEIYDIPDNDPSDRWFWVILGYSTGPWDDGSGVVKTGVGHWFNARCGHKPTPQEAFDAALKAYNEVE